MIAGKLPTTDMDSVKSQPTTACHVVAIPYPGRGHINPMMNLCKSLASKSNSSILVTFVVTEEWLGFIGSESKPHGICLVSIPNVLPSELTRGSDMEGFLEAVHTKMEAPFERLLDRLEPLATLILADSFLSWVVAVGNRRNIPLASFWPMSASFFSVLQHHYLFEQHGHFLVDLSEKGDELVDYIPGVSSTRLAEFPLVSTETDKKVLQRILKVFSSMQKVQYLVITSVYELENTPMDVIKQEFSFPVYVIDPLISSFELKDGDDKDDDSNTSKNDYLKWLDCQPANSVLYVSMGSYIQILDAQFDEIVYGLKESEVPFLWVTREQNSQLKEVCGDMGMVVSWCDQLKVLSHPSVGGFLSHCGWNSVKEGLLIGGIPFLTFPLYADQIFNSKLVVEDWKIGWRMKRIKGDEDNVVNRNEIKELVRKFMDIDDMEVKEMKRRVKQFQEKLRNAIHYTHELFENDIYSFLEKISQY